MIYSVWNPSTKRYDYYRSGSASSQTHAGPPARALGAGALGATAEEAAWMLPINAVKIGAGDMPRGRIAQSAWDSIGSMPWALIAIGVGAYFYMRRKR